MTAEPKKFELQPTLTGELLELRPLREEDFEALFAAASDPLIWEQHPQPTRYQRPVFREFFDRAMQSGGAFAIFDRATGEMIGSSRFYDLNPEASAVKLGYTFFTRKYWGGLYNREQKKLMLAHTFRFVDTALFDVGITNLRSRRAMEKIGARLYKEEKLELGPHCIYRIDRADFLAGPL